MATNSTAQNGSIGSISPERKVNEQVLFVQVLVGIFLYVNCLMIFTFFKKEAFRTNSRYIFFAHTLVCDCIFLVMTDLLLLLSYFRIVMPVGLCLCICVLMSILTFATPLTLTVMSLERYVAICMPLRHAEISTPARAFLSIITIHALSCIQLIIVISVFMASVPLSFYSTDRVCSVEMLIVHKWQGYLRSAISQLYFLVMSSIISFTYVKIMAAAKVASTDNKKTTSKGLRTVLLHAIQLLLCLIQFWCPLIEMAVMEIDLRLFVNLRYFDYITFILAPRCLSPLVYGLRDDKFFIVLKYYAFWGLSKKISPIFADL
ncbi:odorant receptor 131-2-like [Megalops cyprinoides]|uniref:odorant receptor 131-2-like n=1 Tax=Megalops cyprinoides TaxID=118141 RepID=UPI001864E9B7|nr:odorant receptor 131-2-like [Megalops cyprinoides]